ncbi:MAG: M35 family metallo-endopeptidase [Patiriisocius sp.]|uniref:M35 family metallo-endopeptidase n=1 Tax=Patiriisocius sp. TaxID=2822396 RepID=UPI003EF25D51
MAHQVKSPTLKGKKKELTDDLKKLNLTIAQTERLLLDACKLAEQMMAKAYREINAIIKQDNKKWENAFNSDYKLKLWFGEVTRKNHVRDVERRMDSICDRMAKGITIRLRPQKERTHNAQNNGTFFEPKTFKVFPNLIAKDQQPEEGRDAIAAVLIHELMHTWFKDQRIGNTKTYGDQRAKDLAKYDPRKARKSAENYEQYCLDVWRN